MSDRYYIDGPISLGPAVLGGAEAHHLIHVMRAAAGTQLVLFDGSGAEFAASVERVGRSEVQLSVTARREVNRELPFGLTLGVALPKGDRQKWLVEKAVELGVTRIVPLETERSVAQPVEQALARLRRTVVEASKQCGRNRLMRIGEPEAWTKYVRESPVTSCRLMAHPGPPREHQWRPALTSLCPTGAILAIGPEGGFSDEEVSLAEVAGWQIIDLGPRLLRIETAALLLVAMVHTGRAP